MTEFSLCDTPEKLEELKKFAANVNPPHIIPENQGRIIIVKRRSQIIAYAVEMKTPVVIVTWGNNCLPRDIAEASSTLSCWSQIEHGSALTAVELNHPTFPPNVMEKLGYQRLNLELYQKQME